MIYQIIGSVIEKDILLYKILKYEVKRQKTIFAELKEHIHQDLEGIIGEYESSILQLVKERVIDYWNNDNILKIWGKINMTDILDAFEKQQQNQDNVKSAEILDIITTLHYGIFDLFYIKHDNMEIGIFSNFDIDEYAIGYELDSIDTDTRVSFYPRIMNLKILNSQSKVVQKILKKSGFLEKGEFVDLCTIEIKPI